MIKIDKKYTHEYICCLPKELEKRIMVKVRDAVSSLLLSDEEKVAAVKMANCSKVCDLTDTVSIKFV